MEDVQPSERTGKRSLKDALKEYEERLERVEGTSDKKEPKIKIPFKWHFKLGQAKRKAKLDQIPSLIFTKTGFIEGPVYVQIRYGNLITWKDQAYKFRPEALWKLRGLRGTPNVYCIKEIDMEPISNLDLEEIRNRGDSTEHHQFLLKQFLRASTSPLSKFRVSPLVIIIIVAIVGIGAFFLLRGGG